MTAVKRDTSKKHESIINAATLAFRTVGYEATTMDMIAEFAGASKRTVYNHFSSKKILFQAVIEKAMGELLQLKQIPYDKDLSLDEQMEKFADAKLASVQDPSWLSLTKVVLSVFIQEPELAKETIAKAKSGEDSLVTWLEEAKKDGKIKIYDTKVAADLFWAMITGSFIWPMIFTGSLDEKTTKTVKKELILTFLSRYRV